jgi:hypothetical protein
MCINNLILSNYGDDVLIDEKKNQINKSHLTPLEKKRTKTSLKIFNYFYFIKWMRKSKYYLLFIKLDRCENEINIIYLICCSYNYVIFLKI